MSTNPLLCFYEHEHKEEQEKNNVFSKKFLVFNSTVTSFIVYD